MTAALLLCPNPTPCTESRAYFWQAYFDDGTLDSTVPIICKCCRCGYLFTRSRPVNIIALEQGNLQPPIRDRQEFLAANLPAH